MTRPLGPFPTPPVTPALPRRLEPSRALARATPNPARHQTTQKDTLMRTTTTTALGRHDHPPRSGFIELTPVGRVTMLDRLALHSGIALIRWSRRPQAGSPFERGANRVEVQRASRARERAWERLARLTLPPR